MYRRFTVRTLLVLRLPLDVLIFSFFFSQESPTATAVILS